MTHSNRTPEDEIISDFVAAMLPYRVEVRPGSGVYDKFRGDKEALQVVANFILEDRKAQATALLEKLDDVLPVVDLEAWPNERWSYSGKSFGMLEAAYNVRSIIKEAGGLQ